MRLKLTKALLVVDPQNDFCPGGALGVPECRGMIKNINRYIKIFSRKKLPVFVSRDWHPAETKHFKKFGGPWPVHCVQNTQGAAFHPDLKLPKEAIILSKGMDPEKDSYSAFDSYDRNDTSFSIFLKLLNIRELFIAGLATDYCVKYTALDALNVGLKVRVLVDAIEGVDVTPGDSKRALEEIREKGATMATLAEVKNFF